MVQIKRGENASKKRVAQPTGGKTSITRHYTLMALSKEKKVFQAFPLAAKAATF
jgi:hypothetical protein